MRDRDLSMVTEAGEPIIAEGKYSVSVGGGQPNTEAPSVCGNVSSERIQDAPGVAMAVNCGLRGSGTSSALAIESGTARRFIAVRCEATNPD